MIITDPITNNILEECIGDFTPCAVIRVVDEATAKTTHTTPLAVLMHIDDRGCSFYRQMTVLTGMLQVGHVITRHLSNTPTYWTVATQQQRNAPEFRALLRREGSGPHARVLAPNFAQFQIDPATTNDANAFHRVTFAKESTTDSDTRFLLLDAIRDLGPCTVISKLDACTAASMNADPYAIVKSDHGVCRRIYFGLHMLNVGDRLTPPT